MKTTFFSQGREKNNKCNKCRYFIYYFTFKRIKYILLQRKIMCVSVRLIETQKNNQYIQLIYQFITHQTYIYINTQKYKLVTIDKEKKII